MAIDSNVTQPDGAAPVNFNDKMSEKSKWYNLLTVNATLPF